MPIAESFVKYSKGKFEGTVERSATSLERIEAAIEA